MSPERFPDPKALEAANRWTKVLLDIDRKQDKPGSLDQVLFMIHEMEWEDHYIDLMWEGISLFQDSNTPIPPEFLQDAIRFTEEDPADESPSQTILREKLINLGVL